MFHDTSCYFITRFQLYEIEQISSLRSPRHNTFQYLVAQFFQIVKEETVDGTDHFNRIFRVLDILVTSHFHDEAPKTCIAHQLGRFSQDLLDRVRFGGTTRSGNKVGEGFKPGMGSPLDHSVHASAPGSFLHKYVPSKIICHNKSQSERIWAC